MVMFTFCFIQKTPFSGKFVPENQNHQFKLKFGTETNLNMPNPMVVFTFSVFHRIYPFWEKFGLKNQDCQFKLKFGTYSNSNMKN